MVDLALQVGSLLMENGSKISTTKETIALVLKKDDIKILSLKINHHQIKLTILDHGENKEYSKEVRYKSIHLARVSKLHDIKNNLKQNQYTKQELEKDIQEVLLIQSYNPYRIAFGLGLTCVGFCGMKGGSLTEMIPTFFISVFSYLVMSLCLKMKRFILIRNIVIGALVTMCSIFLFWLGIHQNILLVASSGIMFLVTGVALTNGFREMIDLNFQVGIYKCIKALINGAGIAVGVMVILKLYQFITGVTL